MSASACARSVPGCCFAVIAHQEMHMLCSSSNTNKFPWEITVQSSLSYCFYCKHGKSETEAKQDARIISLLLT